MILTLNRAKKEQFFKELFDEYYAPFVLYAKRFVETRDVREDIVSNVFLTVWDKIEKDELNQHTVIGFIKTSVRNSCFNYLKHRKFIASDEEAEHTLGNVFEKEEILTIDELYGKLFRLLEQMPKEQSDVFVKTFIENESQVEIAEEMQISVKTVQRYKKKCLDGLKSKLGEELLAFLLLLLVPMS